MRNKHPTLFEVRPNTNLSRDQKARLKIAEKNNNELLDSFEAMTEMLSEFAKAFEDKYKAAISETSSVIVPAKTTGKRRSTVTEPGNDEDELLQSFSNSKFN